MKYYKGLGTSTAKEAKEYFSDMERHRIPFKYAGPEDDDALLLVRSSVHTYVLVASNPTYMYVLVSLVPSRPSFFSLGRLGLRLCLKV